MKLPGYVKNCISLLENSGYSAYAVGGAVRDSLLGREPSDWDVTTSAKPEDILTVFSDYRTIPTGIKHGTVTVLFEDDGKHVPIEVTTYRIDGEYRDSRHPSDVEFSNSVFDDLSRRDFTVNAMAYNEKDGLIDAFGGRDDLERGIIRTVGDPEKRFSEDALRILRAFRFSAQLGFAIDESTYVAACKCAHLLKNIARERIGAELKRLFASSDPVYALEKMVSGGVWREIFSAAEPKDYLVSKLNSHVLTHFETRLAILLSGFDSDSAEMFMDSLRFSNAEKKIILRLSNVQDFEINDELEKSARQFLHLYIDIFELSLEILDFWHKNEQFLDVLRREYALKRPLKLSSLAIKGNDVLPLCNGDHKRVGLILNSLLELVIEDPTLNERDTLLKIIQKDLV